MGTISFLIMILHLLAAVDCLMKENSIQFHDTTVQANPELSAVITKLWKADNNRLSFGRDIQLSYQQRLRSWSQSLDVSPRPFFQTFDRNILQRGTFKAFFDLLNNYERESGISEIITNSEVSENYRFLNAVLNTPVMKEVHKYLKSKGKASTSISSFKQKLYDVWFTPYYRSSSSRIRDSSAFEHVFVGELKNDYKQGKVSGFHNWIQFYLEEKSNRLNYYGYIRKTLSPYIIVSKFRWYDKVKSVGSMFVGTSPEFEFSLYTLVFMMGYEKVQFSLDNAQIKVTCFGINNNKWIATCYPDIV